MSTTHDANTMLPAAAYTSPAVLDWELRHLYAASWTCVGRLDELLGEGTTHRGVRVGDVPCLLTRAAVDHGVGQDEGQDEGEGGGSGLRMWANTCSHRGHELLPDGGSGDRNVVVCPYHAWTYDLSGRLLAAPGYRDVAGFDRSQQGLVELPVEVLGGWVFAHALHPLGSAQVPSFAEHLGAMTEKLEPYRLAELRLGDRHTYEVAANWKVVAENYHECYHCPQIHPELCVVSPPSSGGNYQLPGQWVGGSLDLREGMETMSLTGASEGLSIPGAPDRVVDYLHALPNLLVSTHPDYVMTHRLLPLAPGRTWIECSWWFWPGEHGELPDPSYAVDFWDITNRQDWAACESVQRGLASPHFRSGPFAPNEDAVARFAGLITAAYAAGSAPLA